MTLTGQSPVPSKLAGDSQALVITWTDNIQHRIPWSILRKLCPCATCRNPHEPDQKPTLLPVITPAEAQPLRGRAMKPVGNYAYGIDFTDGHNTGIYTFDFLRRLGEQIAASA